MKSSQMHKMVERKLRESIAAECTIEVPFIDWCGTRMGKSIQSQQTTGGNLKQNLKLLSLSD